ncbi:MAG: hypothetical protein U0414_32175 [Polyangiaceae bacterium]
MRGSPYYKSDAAPKGVVQAIERVAGAFCIASVAPEFIPQHTRRVALFEALVAAARSDRARRAERRG